MSALAFALYIGIGVVMVCAEIAMCVHDRIKPPGPVQGLAIVLLWPVVLLAILALLVGVMVISAGIWLMDGT